MSGKRYLITLWMDCYEYDNNILRKFSIEYETTDLDEAKRRLNKIAMQRVNEGIKEYQDLAIMQSSVDRRLVAVGVNKNNKVIRKEFKKIGNSASRIHIYYDFDLIEVPDEAKSDESLFNLKNCSQEVRNYFKYSYKK